MLDSRLTLRPWERAALLTVMENLPAIEAWLATLPPLASLQHNEQRTGVRGPAGAARGRRREGKARRTFEQRGLPVWVRGTTASGSGDRSTAACLIHLYGVADTDGGMTCAPVLFPIALR